MENNNLIIYHDIFSKHNWQISVQKQLIVALLLTLAFKRKLVSLLIAFKGNYVLYIHLINY